MKTELHLIGVSAGDATLIRHADADRVYNVLIDGGINRQTAHEYLLANDIRRLDLVVASHLDYDHLGGLLAIFEDRQISIGEYWTFDLDILKVFLESGVIPPPRLQQPKYVLRFMAAWTLARGWDARQQAAKREIPCKQVVAGDVTRFGGLVFEVLYPTADFLEYLHSPETLKRILEKGAIPLEWKIGRHPHSPQEVREEGRRRRHRRVRFPREDKVIAQWVESVEKRFEDWLADDEQALGLVSSYQCEAREARSLWREFPKGEEPGPHPRELCNEDTILNDLSCVFRVSVVGREGFTSLLFTGDLENWTPLIVANASRLRCDVLKVPHHGSDSVGWSPEHAFEFLIARAQRLRRSPWWLWCEEWCRRYCWEGHPRTGRWPTGGVEDILDIAGPAQAVVFPFPRHGLPSQTVMRLMDQRGVVIHANRADGSDLRSSGSRLQDRVLEIA
ncbi:MAG TPA: MBL fold metallo-hydrolase [Bryobacteraceae bacterium]|nr:MBL fold metallo-hydrolase [Bryobacteraceae bacterium]